jgi:NAD(P)-dependent dehydrogenase (short-subunit alcohol dehydrogenase family)
MEEDPEMPQPLTISLEGRTALVTGGGTGIGKACAGAMARLGAVVTIAGPDAAVLEQAADDLRPDGAVRFVRADVTEEDQVAAAVDAAAAAGGGRLDIALANAGTGFPGSLLHLSKEHWMVPLGVNVLGTAFTIKHAAQKMRSSGGSIITVSSGASSRLTKFMMTYSVTKAAVDELTRAAAQELGPFGIRVNCVRPGWIETQALAAAATESNRTHALAQTPLGRLGEVDDIARAVIYLASDQSEWVTGQLLNVCGGFNLIPPSMDLEGSARALFPDEMARDFGSLPDPDA